MPSLQSKIRARRGLSSIALAVAGALVVSGLVAIVPAAPAQAAVPAAPAVTTAHPRLVATAADFTRLRSQVKSDPAAAKVYAVVKAEADGYLAAPLVTYVKPDGIRLLATSQTMVKRAYALGTMYELTGNAAYANRLWSDLNAAGHFPDWNPDHFLDTAEMTNAFAVSYDWLYAHWSAAQRTALATWIATKGLTPSLAVYRASPTSGGPYKYGGNWSQLNNNWNVVVNSGMAMGAMAIMQANPTVAKPVLADALASVQKGVSSFANGGGWAEGLGYWEYATRYFTLLAASLQTATGSTQGLLTRPGIAQTGYFPLYATSGSASFNFADSPAGTFRSSSLEALGKLLNDPVLRGAGAAPNASGSNVQRLLSLTPVGSTATANTARLALDRTFPNAGVTTFHSSWTDPNDTFVGFRSSNTPSAGHQNLDAGTFSLASLGQTWAEELGKDDYGLSGYFETGADGDRWNYYRERAEGQNTLVILPSNPSSGFTTNTTPAPALASNASSAYSVADLSSVYGGGITSWKRGVKTFDDKTQVVVQDEVTAKGPFDALWSMHTQAAIRISSDGRAALLYKGGKVLAARITSPGDASFSNAPSSPSPTSPNPAKQTANTAMRTLEIDLHGNSASTATLTVQFTPVTGSIDDLPSAAPVVPLSNWSLDAAGSSRATGLTVGGVAVPGFRGDVQHYTVNVDPGAAVPEATAAAASGATVLSTAPRTVPGDATVTVTNPGRTPTTYTLTYLPGPVAGVTVSTIVPGEAKYGPPDLTLDGNTSTWWGTGSVGHGLIYTLKTPTVVRSALISWVNNTKQHTGYTLQTSTDGTNYTTQLTSAYDGPAGDQVIRFPSPQAVKAIKFVLSGDGSADPFSGIAEAGFYGYDATPPAVPSAGTHLSSVALAPTPASVAIRSSTRLTVSAADNGARAMAVSGTHFVTSNPAVATVDANGVVHAVGVGSARVGVIVTLGGYRATAGTAISVVDPSKVHATADSDAYGQAGSSATKNFGTARQLLVKPKIVGQAATDVTRISVVHFSLKNLVGKRVTSAVVSVHGKVSDSRGSAIVVDAHNVAAAWSEKTLTYATLPKFGSRMSSATFVTAGNVGRFDVTALVNAKGFNGSLSLGLTEDAPPSKKPILAVIASRETATPPVFDAVLAG